MSETSHIHTDDIVVDSDVHFTIDTTTRMISNQNADKVNKKLSLIQHDIKSERYSFDIDRYIDGHDLMLCNRVQIHFINIGTGRNQRSPGANLIDDVHINESDDKKITFSWLVPYEATVYNGELHFLVTFECVGGANILYRWSTTTFTAIKITAGMNNNNTVFEMYSDDLLNWQNTMATEVIPDLVDRCYIEREFATSEEVAQVFGVTVSE